MIKWYSVVLTFYGNDERTIFNVTTSIRGSTCHRMLTQGHADIRWMVTWYCWTNSIIVCSSNCPRDESRSRTAARVPNKIIRTLCEDWRLYIWIIKKDIIGYTTKGSFITIVVLTTCNIFEVRSLMDKIIMIDLPIPENNLGLVLRQHLLQVHDTRPYTG